MPDTDGIALLTSLIDAALRLAAEHRQFVGALIRCGLIDDHTRAVLTARLDQLDAVTTDLQARRALLNSGSGSRLPGSRSRRSSGEGESEPGVALRRVV